MALIRYPGSKAKLAKQIMRQFPCEIAGPLFQQTRRIDYREPFFGAGAVGFQVLESLPGHCEIWLNDKDPGMHALWSAVAWNPWELCERISAIEPSAALFYRLKEEDGRRDLPTSEMAVRKLALHRLSYSGLGYMSGGPLGGRNQSSEYNVDCRWNPETMRGEIAKLHASMKRFGGLQITNLDFAKVIEDATEDSFVYLDPPYYEKGPQLYRYSMDEEDHHLLAVLLRKSPANWVLSYDDHPEIRRLYSWAQIKPITIRYVMGYVSAETRPKNQEVLILPQAKEQA